MKIHAFLLTALLAIPTLALAEDKPKTDKPATSEKTGQLSAEDLRIIAHVKHVNDMEIKIGKLAQKKGTPPVKKYGAMLVNEHGANNTKLVALAKRKKVAKIPDAEPVTEQEKQDHQAMMDGMAKLETLQGAEFDKELLTMMVDGHDKEVAHITTAMASVSDPDLATFLTNTKPVVQRHADTARELQKKAVSMK